MLSCMAHCSYPSMPAFLLRRDTTYRYRYIYLSTRLLALVVCIVTRLHGWSEVEREASRVRTCNALASTAAPYVLDVKRLLSHIGGVSDVKVRGLVGVLCQ